MHCITQRSQGKYLIKLLSQAFCRKLSATLTVATLPLASLDNMTQIEFFLYAAHHRR
jgi:hypothetical protein